MKALIFDIASGVLPWLSQLLIRSGFYVDAVSTVPNLKLPIEVKNIYVKSPTNLLSLVSSMVREGYNLVVPCSDFVLLFVLQSNLSVDTKLSLLPVNSPEHFLHIFSKVGLSRALEKSDILIPKYRVAVSWGELAQMRVDFKDPFFIKNDRSGGGSGVFLLNNISELNRFGDKFIYPVLVQEQIIGKLVDLSSFYQKKKLVFFSYSDMLICRPNEFGPSVVRRYYKNAKIAPKIINLLISLGEAIGADGFVNVSAIITPEREDVFLIEADMRPNIWVEHSKFICDDPAAKIRDYFLNGKFYGSDELFAIDCCGGEKTAIIPHIDRLTSEEIVTNFLNCENYRLDSYWTRP